MHNIILLTKQLIQFLNASARNPLKKALCDFFGKECILHEAPFGPVWVCTIFALTFLSEYVRIVAVAPATVPSSAYVTPDSRWRTPLNTPMPESLKANRSMSVNWQTGRKLRCDDLCTASRQLFTQYIWFIIIERWFYQWSKNATHGLTTIAKHTPKICSI